MDHIFHTSCAVLLHLPIDMRVNLEREFRRGVTEISLNGFYIIPALQTKGCVRVPQIVKAHVQSQFLRNALVAVVYRPIGQISARGIAEHHVLAFPQLTEEGLLFQL